MNGAFHGRLKLPTEQLISVLGITDANAGRRKTMFTTQKTMPSIPAVIFGNELIRWEPIERVENLSLLSLVHDLRNPIAAVCVGAEMLVQGDLSPEQSRRIVLNVYRASAHADRLLKNLAKIWRGEGEALRLWDLADFVNDICEAIAAAAQSQMVAIEIDIPDFIEVAIQRTRMESVFLNLLTNALEAMPCGGMLSLRARAEADSAVIDVDDSGPGISKLVLNNLFQPFATAKQGGLGLGLMLSRQAVLEQQGDLWLAEKSGPGARFCVRLSTKLA
jgi:signal transduction histidine kinase